MNRLISQRHRLIQKFMISCFWVAVTTSAHGESSFNQVEEIIYGTPPAASNDKIAKEQAVYLQGLLPQYKVSVANFFSMGINQLIKDSHRTIAEDADFLPRVEKLVHSNGICFSGQWNITEPNEYSGYFSEGSQGLFIGRASTALSATKRGNPRAFGFAGKLFASNDPTDATPTANFFTIDVLSGAQRARFMDVQMTNQPPLGFQFNALYIGLFASAAFASADNNPGFRPLYPIAELGLNAGEEAKWPRYMMLQTDPEITRNDEEDFRDELDFAQNGLTKLRLQILVNEDSVNRDDNGWQQIGYIDLNESVVSYGCDRQLHFSHPKLK